MGFQERVKRENGRLKAKYQLTEHPQFIKHALLLPTGTLDRHWFLIFALAGAYDKSQGRQGLTDSVLAWYRLYDEHGSQRPVEMYAGKVRLKIACGPGCSHCCTTEVTILPPEAVVIANYIKAHLSDGEKQELAIRIGEHQQQPASTGGPRPLCPLNVGGECTVYPVRPFACRTFHSFDLSTCYKIFVSGDYTGLPPMDIERFDGNAVFWNSATVAFRAIMAIDSGFELVSALEIALTDESVADRMLLNENPLRDAKPMLL